MTSEPSGERPQEQPPDALSRDVWLGGRLRLVQPRAGHRVGSDAALLAAAIDMSEGRLVDVGAGVGAVGLAIAHRSPGLKVDLIEIDPGLALLASENAICNGLADRARVLAIDIADPRARRAAGVADDAADAVLTNPPFLDPARSRISPDPARARAHAFEPGERAPLDPWLRGCLAILKPGGRFVMIHRADALAAILAPMENRLGALALLPVYPRAGVAAHRLLVSGVKGSKGPLRVAPGLVLHQAGGRLTNEADAIHRGERLIDWGG